MQNDDIGYIAKLCYFNEPECLFLFFHSDVQSVLRFPGRGLELDYTVNLPSSKRSLYITAGSSVANLCPTDLLLLPFHFVRLGFRCCCLCEASRVLRRVWIWLSRLQRAEDAVLFYFPFLRWLYLLLLVTPGVCIISCLGWIHVTFSFPYFTSLYAWGISVWSYNTYYTLELMSRWMDLF